MNNPPDVRPNPIPHVIDEPKVSALLERCAMTFDEKGHAEPFKNDIARHLNLVLARVQWTLETDGCDVDVEFAEAALALVDRVADFEEIMEAP